MPSIINREPLIDLNQIQNHSLNSLVDIFQRISQDESLTHLLVLDRSISKYINRLTPFSNLKSLTNIENVIWLDASLDTNILQLSKSIVFFSHDTLPNIELISNIVKTKVIPLNHDVKISLIFTSSNTQFDNLVFEHLNLKGDVDIYNWDKLKPIQLAPDVLSLDEGTSLKNLYQQKSISSLTTLSQTLLNLVVLSNFKLRITNTFTKGDLSRKFLQDYQKSFDVYKTTMGLKEKKLLDDIDDCLFLDKHTFYNKQCDLVILERSVDLISPLLQQLTYMGLIDEFYGIDLNEVEIPEPHSKTRIRVDDELINNELKDLNFSQVGPILNKRLKLLQEEFESRHNAKDIKQIKNFVDRLNELTEQQNLVKNHTLIAESILNKVKAGTVDEEDEDESYFSKMIDLQQQIISNNYDNTTNCAKLMEFMYVYKPPLNDLLKLLVLTSIVKKGIRQKEYRIFEKEVIENYGFKVFSILRTLNELKLFYIREANTDNFSSLFISSETVANTLLPVEHFNPTAQLIKDFNQVNYFLNLIPSDTEEGQEPDFVLPGYIPVIARLIQAIYSRDFISSSSLKVNTQHKPGWTKLNEGLNKNFYGSDEFQETLLVPESKKFIFDTNDSVIKNRKSKETEYIIFVMIGGITQAELAAVRFVITKINKDLGYNKQLLVLTDNVIKSDDIVEMCM